ncbi:hypothetical protein F5884DRAFT_892419 [Xylogone sp. PMI_703]|nr:hypothetical protein F5884DRAFT_892419 [Xylogone sp. PMI_703]
MGSHSVNYHIAIIGGGIGGLVCALSLAHHCPGIHIDVYEQAPEYKEIGAGIGIGVNAAKLLHKLGLGEAINAIAGRRNGIWISFRRGDTGEEIVTPAADDSNPIRQMPVHRAEFLDLLKAAVVERRAATLHTNKRLKTIKEIEDKVWLHFEDGTETTADVVVGCDGIHSTVRGHFVSDNPRYSGRIAYRGLVPINEIESFWPLSSYSASWLNKDKHFLVFPVSQNKTLNIVAFVTKNREDMPELEESWTTTADRAELENEYKGFDPVVRKVITHMPSRPGKWLINDRDPLEQWVFCDGKVVLMGDAAHAMLPHQGKCFSFCPNVSIPNPLIAGAGAGQAIEDGYIFGRAMQDYLRTGMDLKKWTQVYQDVRLPRAQKAQRTAREAGIVYELQADDMKGKTLEECVPEIRNRLKDRMNWIWKENIDAIYEEAACK